ncbi:hypothetical protein [Nocardia iowensis]|uniref:Uncharacterized protein n=1 Tax=Nocardia iowensis TaxID=204891 RepID=A0ABX8RJ56_NOCIO|nr:hypothetical protein [Nocardia iowensis]QXN88485.1 hypothetical protein KV110_23090 [Nocardia iowensis]
MGFGGGGRIRVLYAPLAAVAVAAVPSFVGPVAGPARALPTTGVGIHIATDSDDALIDQARTRARYVEGRTGVVASFLTPKECEDPELEAKKAVKSAVEAADSAEDAASASRAAADAAEAALPAYTCLVGVLPQMIEDALHTRAKEEAEEALPRARAAEKSARAAADAEAAAAESPTDTKLANDAAKAEEAATWATVRIRYPDKEAPPEIEKIDE